jgi:predicted GNAT family acetyltransferase
MLQGNVKGAFKFLTESEKGGVLMPNDINVKTGDTIEEVLKSKHPNARTPDVSQLLKYDEKPEFVEVDITRLSRSAGAGGVDAKAVSHWLLQFRKKSQQL